MLVAGADGCRSGWLVVMSRWQADSSEQATARLAEAEVLLAPTFDDLVEITGEAEVVGVDMPIGMLDVAVSGGRDCDREARRVLGQGRASSVFSPPVRPALVATTHSQAVAIQRNTAPQAPGLSVQCFHLFPKIREIDQRITPQLQERIREVHPELAFARLADQCGRGDGRGLQPPKRSRKGRELRQRLLRQVGYAPMLGRERELRPKGAALDDLLDACVVAWSAGRIARGEAVRLPELPPRDRRGLRMEIWS